MGKVKSPAIDFPDCETHSTLFSSQLMLPLPYFFVILRLTCNVVNKLAHFNTQKMKKRERVSGVRSTCNTTKCRTYYYILRLRKI